MVLQRWIYSVGFTTSMAWLACVQYFLHPRKTLQQVADSSVIVSYLAALW